MYSIEKNTKNEYIIQKSHFITLLFKIDSKDDINIYLEQVKQEYQGATHYCYAYILDGDIKCSDDGEPSKTAGSPILHVLEMNELNHILCIVVRYFGGIKLGAGGLVRAYTKSITDALETTNIVDLQSGYLIEITFEHSSIKQIDYVLKNYDINKNYDLNIKYTFSIKKEDLEDIKNKLNSFIKDFKIIKEIYIS